MAETSKQQLYTKALALLARADELLDGIRSRSEARLAAILAEIDLRFSSGNSVPVGRASIKASEWAAIRQYVSATLAQRPAHETTEKPGIFDWLECPVTKEPCNCRGFCKRMAESSEKAGENP